MKSILALSVVAMAVLGGCAPKGERTSPSATSQPTSDSPFHPTLAAGGESFVDSGRVVVAGRDAGDAVQVSSLIAASHAGGERLVIGFSRADGFPASTLGEVTVEFLRQTRVIRVHLPAEVVSTAITDNTFTGDYSDRAYVVRSRESAALYVDLHLRSAAVARPTVYSAPALVSIELQRGGSTLPPWPSVGARVVVLAPPRDGRTTYPIEVEGYARTFEANVVAELRQDGKIRAKAVTTAADYVSAWGEYRLRFTDGPRGPVQLFVGEHSAKDGSAEGVTADLFVEGSGQNP
ncbi:MAG TPA: Gmad2 immunoglobulin-like domain-containing protein [Candidatus Limnocylindria bacterium]|nr:Gmad2 immunoglobulin-like domain-containing protein [Candidatus Limnocylindria bacterium]